MLKIYINVSPSGMNTNFQGPVTEIEMSGTLVDLMTDLTFGLCTIYSRLKKSSSDCAEDFRELLTEVVNDPKGPLWNINPAPADVDYGMLLPNPTKGGTL